MSMARSRFTAEIPLLCVYFTYMMIAGIALNLNLYKTCYTLMDYPEKNCSRIGIDTDDVTQALEDKVQSKGSFVTTITEMVPGSVPIIVALLIGSWSDKYGRKPVMVLALGSLTVQIIFTSILLLIDSVNPFQLMIAALPVITCGGPTTFFSVTLAYLNDISTDETRGLRMVAFEVIVIFSTCFGTLLSTTLVYAATYATVYAIGGFLVGFATVYTIFFVPESLVINSKEKPTLSNTFTCDNLTGMFKTVAKKRPSNERSTVLLLLFTKTLFSFVTNGESNVKTLYVRKVLGWTLGDKNKFTSWSGVCTIIATILLTLVLHKKFKIKELVLVLPGICSTIGVSILYGLAQNSNYIYGSVVVGLMGGLTGPMLVTKLGHIMAADEMGKMFSVISVTNSISQLLAGLSYSWIYENTTKTHPEAFNWFSIGLLEICILLVAVVMLNERKQSRIQCIEKAESQVDHHQVNEKST